MYTALIVEPRKHKALELVFNNFNRNLDEKWMFLIFHGIENKEYILDILIRNKIDKKRDIKMVDMCVNNLTKNDYNILFFSNTFYDKIETETFLVFQTDTLISDKYANTIYDFLEYDYVGAPWRFDNDYNSVGNGGLSLRKKSKMIEMIIKGGYLRENGEPYNEDVFFSNTSAFDNKNNYRSLYKPSFEVASKFSVETYFSDNSFGLHNPWCHLKTEYLNEMKKLFPELEELINLHKL